MTDLPCSSQTKTGVVERVSWPHVLYATVAVAALSGFLVGRVAGGETGDVEGPLLLLLRFMATMKLVGVAGALALTHWRLRRPIAPGLAMAYIATLVPLAVAPGLIWSLAHVALAALFFHVGLLAFLYLAWKDDGVVMGRRRAAKHPVNVTRSSQSPD